MYKITKTKIFKRNIELLIKSNEATIGFPLGATLIQYNVKAIDFVNLYNSLTINFLNIIFKIILIIYKSGEFDYIIIMPEVKFFLNFFIYDNKFNEKKNIKKTDIYNITKLKCGFNFFLIKKLYIMIFNSIKQKKNFLIIND